MPEVVGGSLNFISLTSIDTEDTEITMPKEIGDNLYLNRLTSTQGITNWPIKIGNSIFASQALPDNEKEELKKQYPDQVQFR